jgi:hypothetical protein
MLVNRISVVALWSALLATSARAHPINDWEKVRDCNVVFADHTFSGDFKNHRLDVAAWNCSEPGKTLPPNTITSVIIADGFEGVFSTEENKKGRLLTLEAGAYPNLDAFGFNDSIKFVQFQKAPTLPPKAKPGETTTVNQWWYEDKANVVFADHTFSGDFRNRRLEEGAWNCGEREKMLPPNTITSVIVAPRWICVLFEKENFEGAFLVLSVGHCPNLDKYKWNDRAKSVRFISLEKAAAELAKLGVKSAESEYFTKDVGHTPRAGGPNRAPASDQLDADLKALEATNQHAFTCARSGVGGMFFGKDCKQAQEAREKADRDAAAVEAKDKSGNTGGKGKTEGGRNGGG